jgi:hypothetical protein
VIEACYGGSSRSIVSLESKVSNWKEGNVSSLVTLEVARLVLEAVTGEGRSHEFTMAVGSFL